MGKRKQTAPQHADQAKRQQLQWNMTDQFVSSGSQSFICDNTLKNENLNQTEHPGEAVSPPTPLTGESSSSFITPVHALCVDAFYQNLASCHTTLTLYSSHLFGDNGKSKLYEFGTFKITLKAHPKLNPLPDQLPEFKECWLYLADADNPSMLYFETEDNNENVQQKKPKSRQSKFGIFWFVSLNIPVSLLTSLRSKVFALLCGEFDTHQKDFQVTIYGSEGVVMRLSHPSEAVRIKMPHVAVQRMMEYFYDICLPYNYESRERTTGHDFFQLYESVMSIHLDRLSRDESWTSEVDSIRHDCLKPVLRHYQKQSVAWMLRQECFKRKGVEKDELHPLYCEVNLKDGTRLYYNRHAGSLISDRPKVIPNLPGGILADEMGLGKTVEVLCCMLLHPRQNVELPEELPVLDESTEESDENCQSSNPSTETVIDNVQKSDAADNHETLKSLDERTFANKGSDLPTALGDLEESDKLSKKDVIAEELTVSPNIPTIESCTKEDRNPLLCDSGKGLEEDMKISITESQLVSVPSPPRFEVVSDEITFLSSKTTIDLVDDAAEDTADSGASVPFSTSNSISEGLQMAENINSDNLGPDIKKPRITSDGLKSSGNKVVIKINSQKEAFISVEHHENITSLSSKGTRFAHTSLNATNSLTNPPSECSTPQEVLLSDSPLQLLTSQSSSETNLANSTQDERKKGKRKSKGYVEYVPITSDELDYFSTKPTARKQYFECNCGQLDDEEETRKKGLHTVKCNVCGMSQHAECMNYDLRDPFRGEYKCPHCHAVHTTIKSGATLIISPYSICHQWIEEISKHIKERSIKVFIYTGVSKLGYIQPQTLAHQDIVITTYDVLRKEVDYVNLPHTNSESGRRFRHPKRFLATPSPMVAVEWWRICLDEAQMVECVTTKTAEMALKLKAVNRWCVTGTPLMRSVEDIYGLLLFLGVDPLLVQQWFRLLVWEPFCHGILAPMHHALSQVMWRTAKKDVIDQIDLPIQTEEVNWLTFSPVEEHFYRRQYEFYLRNAYALRKRASAKQDPSTKLHALDRKTMNELLSPLFRLRQACCHPQIVRGEFLPLNKAMMTMEELLEHMTKKVKTECEEAHRQIVASLNGTAGLAILRGKLPQAVEKYRDVLRSVEEHKDQFRTDDLQQLHAMYNLAEVLDKKPAGVSPTLRDSSLKEQCEELKTKYMSRTKANVAASHESLEITQAAIKDITRKISTLDGDWWADVVEQTMQRSIDNDLIYKIKDDLVRTSTTEGTIADTFTNADGLMYVIDLHLQTLTKARTSLTTALSRLAKDTSPEVVQKAATCCMRPVEEILKNCPFCKVDELFNEYESKLFLFVERGVTVTGDDSNLAYQVSTKRQGTWADSEVERALKSILAFYRLHFDPDHDTLEAASLQVKHLDFLKKEFKNLRSLWLSHREMVSAIDELAMATERLRLREKFEPESATKILNIIEEREMLQHEFKCSADEIVGRDDLRKKLGQLVYLTNLAKKKHDGDSGNPDVCPICQCELGVEWSVLMCGHCFCLRCIRAMIDRNLVGGNLIERRLKCPMCRHMTPMREISYVTTKKTEKVDVKGSHSTKVQAVIECLIKIRQQDPTAKSLVFSVWVSVLDILAAGLAENKIPYKSLHDPNYFQKNLTAFRLEESIQVLLLPLHTGANGLNLVEANHVLLVEPELNLEEEAQAISRIYRIGQTRQTKIHWFLVRGTIEEKIYHMVKTLRESKSGESEEGETVELTVGHITSLLQQPGPDDDDEEEGEEEDGSARQGNSGNSVGGVASNVVGDGGSTSSSTSTTSSSSNSSSSERDGVADIVIGRVSNSEGSIARAGGSVEIRSNPGPAPGDASVSGNSSVTDTNSIDNGCGSFSSSSRATYKMVGNDSAVEMCGHVSHVSSGSNSVHGVIGASSNGTVSVNVDLGRTRCSTNCGSDGDLSFNINTAVIVCDSHLNDVGGSTASRANSIGNKVTSRGSTSRQDDDGSRSSVGDELPSTTAVSSTSASHKSSIVTVQSDQISTGPGSESDVVNGAVCDSEASTVNNNNNSNATDLN